MSFCKLITIQILLVASFISVFTIPKYIPSFGSSLLKHPDEKGTIFFLISFFPILNSFLYLFFYEMQSKKSQKHLRISYFETLSLYFLTFVNVISAYIYKVDFSVLLKVVVFISINNQLLFIFNLFQSSTLKYYFSFNCLISNLIILGLSFFEQFDHFCVKRVEEIMKYKHALMRLIGR